LVGTTQEDFRGQIPPLLTAQRADDDDRLERELLYPSGYVAPTPLALDHEQHTFLNPKGHGRTRIGEDKAKAQLSKPGGKFGVNECHGQFTASRGYQ
jgi:hypothetical protein